MTSNKDVIRRIEDILFVEEIDWAVVGPELAVVLEDTLNNGLIYWEPITNRGVINKAEMVARLQRLLVKARP